MKTTTSKQTETLKSSIDNASRSSKESIRTLIQSNSLLFNSALEKSSKTFSNITKLLSENQLDPAFVSDYKGTLVKSLELSEGVVNSIIDSHTKRVEQTVEFTAKLLEIVKSEDLNTSEGVNKIVELAKENLDRSTELSINNLGKINTVYNEHLNLAVAFNKKFADTINSQVASVFKLQSKSIYPIDTIADWWKN
ncbi:MAG TPA: hypothetical protein VK783_00210 [Bacteroidia bacterium]|jgi:hypothetical protein|nr:hypothetical protein [Bacteroidia bacterium]